MEKYIYIAYCGLPYFSGYFYVINLSTHIHFMDLISKGSYEEAERYLVTNKFMNDFFGPGLPLKWHMRFGGFSWTEYQRCFTDACYRHLLETYLMKNMLKEADVLRRSPKWWIKNIPRMSQPNLLDECYYDFVMEYLTCLKARPAEEKVTTQDQFYAVSYPKIGLSGKDIYDQAMTIKNHISGIDLETIKKYGKSLPIKYTKNGLPIFGINNLFVSVGYYYRKYLEGVKFENTEYKPITS